MTDEAQLDLEPQIDCQLWKGFSIGWDVASRKKKSSRKAKKAAWAEYLERLSRSPAGVT